MNHLFWLWVGGFLVALASASIASGVFRVKTTLRSLFFELVTLVFWPITLIALHLQQKTIRKALVHKNVSCSCGNRCENCEAFRTGLQERWLEHHRTCLSCHPEE